MVLDLLWHVVRECCDERAEDEKKKKLALKSQDVGDKALAILQKRGLSSRSK
jgi:hypothetical protein